MAEVSGNRPIEHQALGAPKEKGSSVKVFEGGASVIVGTSDTPQAQTPISEQEKAKLYKDLARIGESINRLNLVRLFSSQYRSPAEQRLLFEIGAQIKPPEEKLVQSPQQKSEGQSKFEQLKKFINKTADFQGYESLDKRLGTMYYRTKDSLKTKKITDIMTNLASAYKKAKEWENKIEKGDKSAEALSMYAMYAKRYAEIADGTDGTDGILLVAQQMFDKCFGDVDRYDNNVDAFKEKYEKIEKKIDELTKNENEQVKKLAKSLQTLLYNAQFEFNLAKYTGTTYAKTNEGLEAAIEKMVAISKILEQIETPPDPDTKKVELNTKKVKQELTKLNKGSLQAKETQRKYQPMVEQRQREQDRLKPVKEKALSTKQRASVEALEDALKDAWALEGEKFTKMINELKKKIDNLVKDTANVPKEETHASSSNVVVFHF